MATTTDLTVANTILAQLGGRRFMAMTGSKGFLGDDNSLSFRLARNPGGWTTCKITLNGADLYDVTFCRVCKLEVVQQCTDQDIYAEDLQQVFTANTGLYTSL